MHAKVEIQAFYNLFNNQDFIISTVHCPSSLSCIDLFWLCVTDWILESYNDLLIKSGTRFALGLVSIAHISAAFLCVEHLVVEFVALFVSDKMFVWT